jgi:uncharacterized protein YjiS (DUF1127 family)
MIVSTLALLRNPSRALAGIAGVGMLVDSIWGAIQRRIKVARDRRVLQTLPDHVLADLGLEKMDIMAGTGDRRHVWIIPHRHH